MMQSWFQCRTHYSKSMENGKERKVNEVYLVDAILWGEAEERIIKELTPFVREGSTLYIDDIARFSIDSIIEKDATEADDRYYKVVQAFVVIDEDSGDEKRNNYKYLVRASDTDRAQRIMEDFNKDSMGDWIIVSIQETPIMDVYYYSSDGAIADIVNAHSDISPSCYLYEKTIKKEAVKEKVLIECKKYVEDICRNDGKAINIRKRTTALIEAVAKGSCFDIDKLRDTTLELIKGAGNSENYSNIAAWYLGCLSLRLDYIDENYTTWKEAFIDADTGEQVWITRVEKKQID